MVDQILYVSFEDENILVQFWKMCKISIAQSIGLYTQPILTPKASKPEAQSSTFSVIIKMLKLPIDINISTN